MQALGIPVVEHLAFCETWSLTGLQEDILITRGFDGQPLHLVEGVDAQRVVEFVNRCHDKGMVHGDLHPANILINPATGELRLADLKGVRIEQQPDRAKAKRGSGLPQHRFSHAAVAGITPVERLDAPKKKWLCAPGVALKTTGSLARKPTAWPSGGCESQWRTTRLAKC